MYYYTTYLIYIHEKKIYPFNKFKTSFITKENSIHQKLKGNYMHINTKL